MYLAQIFRHSALLGLAVSLCLATILWCTLLARRQKNPLDRFLAGLLGLISIYQALRILKDSGVLVMPGIPALNGFVDFIVAALYLLAALILKISSIDRASTKVRLRLVEANEKTQEMSRASTVPSELIGAVAFEASPLAMVTVDVNGITTSWNAAAERTLGWKRDEIVGQPSPIRGKGWRPRAKDGREIEGAVWSAPLRSPGGTVRGQLLVIADAATLHQAGLAPAYTPARETEQPSRVAPPRLTPQLGRT
jgi:PAS domain-containing protein